MPPETTPLPASSPSRLCDPLDHNLTFTLGSEAFGIQVLHIKHVAVPSEPSPAHSLNPLTYPYAQSQNLDAQNQGADQVIPVAALALDFDFKPRAYADRNCIVVLGKRLTPGPSVANGAAPVLNIASEEIELSPASGDGAPMPYLLGMARVQGKVKLLSHPIHALLKLTGEC